MDKYGRLPYELDTKIDDTLTTAYAGTPLVVELFRATGGAKTADEKLRRKERNKGLSPSEMLESFFVLWAAGGERCEDFERLREDEALETLVGHGFPAPQTARDFLEGFEEEDLPLWFDGDKAKIREESRGLRGLGEVNREVIRFLQEKCPEKTATLDVDATIVESTKRAAKMTYEGVKGYQPVSVLWSEQDLILHEEFRDGNVPAGAGNCHVIEESLKMLPEDVHEFHLRGDSALYEDKTMALCEERGIGYVISADMSPELYEAIRALPEGDWRIDAEDSDAVREWAEVVYVPSERGSCHKDTPCVRRFLAIRVVKRQGRLFADGSDRRHFAVVTNREGAGLELIRWHRLKAGTVEHTHDEVLNDLAGWTLPSQKFGANAAWYRMNSILYNLLSAMKKAALPKEYRDARPKRLRFLLFNVVGRVIQHARETLCRVKAEMVRVLYGLVRVRIHARTRLRVALA